MDSSDLDSRLINGSLDPHDSAPDGISIGSAILTCCLHITPTAVVWVGRMDVQRRLCIHLCFFYHAMSRKPKQPRSPNLTQIWTVHLESWKPIILESKDKGQGHEAQKNIDAPVSAGFFEFFWLHSVSFLLTSINKIAQMTMIIISIWFINPL